MVEKNNIYSFYGTHKTIFKKNVYNWVEIDLEEKKVIKDPINTIEDLIYVGETYKNNVYTINISILKKIVPFLKKLIKMIGLEEIKKALLTQLLYFSIQNELTYVNTFLHSHKHTTNIQFLLYSRCRFTISHPFV